MVRGRVASVAAAASAALLLAAGCTSDDPEQTLPCEFYEGQVETGAIEVDDVPDQDCRDQIRDTVRQGENP